MNRELVVIEWHDSRRPISEWRYLSDLEGEGPLVCKSVGWLIDDGETKLLCQTVGDADEDGAQGMGIIQIPAVAVISVYPLAPLAELSERPSGGPEPA